MKNAQIRYIWCCRLLLVAKFPDFFLLVLREIKVCSPADNHIIYYAFLVFGYVNVVEYLKSKNSEMTDEISHLAWWKSKHNANRIV